MNKQDFQAVLWDINKENVEDLPIDFIIQRVLSYGGIFLIVKTMQEYGALAVKQVFASMKPTSISGKKYFYLKNFLLV
ncbi:MAG: hypothetical protein HY228_02425 [Candidatus Yonathbacteria bacterium]|nr:hypothetical protein [Candidatus Yonathbacteria bacterium]